MAQANRVSAVITDQAAAEVKAAINSIGTNLPFLIDLSPEEIKALPRFGDKSLGFVRKALELAERNSDFLPRSFSVEEFRKDVDLYEKLYSFIQPLRGLLEKLEDTFLEVGAESYSSGLLVYSTAKISRGELAGLESLLDDLGKRFLRKVVGEEDQPEQPAGS